MKIQSILRLLAAALAPLLLFESCLPCCVNFETNPVLTVGQRFEPPTNLPNTSIFSACGQKADIVEFHSAGRQTFFNRATVEAATPVFGNGQILNLNNVSLLFRVPLGVKTVRFDFLDKGGFENLSINGSPPFIGELIAAPASLGGASVSVVHSAVAGGKKGTVTIQRASGLNSFIVGGQEFYIDNVCFLKKLEKPKKPTSD